MDIEDYEVPNILFLKGCFLDNCSNIEDIFDQKLMIESQQCSDYYEIANITYDKLPTEFESLSKWPVTTNLKCWGCDCNFHNRPIFIPNSIEHNNKMDTHGNFCSWGCAALYIDLHYNLDEKWEKHAMLRKLYKIFTGNNIKDIIPAIPKTEMIQYGGKKTVKEYRDALSQLNNAYITAIRHNSIDSLSPIELED